MAVFNASTSLPAFHILMQETLIHSPWFCWSSEKGWPPNLYNLPKSLCWIMNPVSMAHQQLKFNCYPLSYLPPLISFISSLDGSPKPTQLQALLGCLLPTPHPSIWQPIHLYLLLVPPPSCFLNWSTFLHPQWYFCPHPRLLSAPACIITPASLTRLPELNLFPPITFFPFCARWFWT